MGLDLRFIHDRFLRKKMGSVDGLEECKITRKKREKGLRGKAGAGKAIGGRRED